MGNGKRVCLSLVGLDSNAFVLMAAFRKQARKEGWTDEEIKAVLTEAQSGDYDNLLRVLLERCSDPEDE